jgi:hypothetical protein
VIQQAAPAAGEALASWLRPLDERFDAATVRATSPFYGDADPESPRAASRWHRRIPANLVGELKDDMAALGITAA